LKRKCDEPLSNVAFNFNLRRYTEVRAYREATTKLYRGTTTAFDQSVGAILCTNCAAGTYQPDSGGVNSDACLACPQGQYSNAGAAGCTVCPSGTYQPYVGMAGRCRLTLSKPELKARLVSALETQM
jgi:hypothetical protein